jgi:hypothetical protein
MSTVIERDTNGKPLIAGDDIDVIRDVGEVTPTDPLVKAWLTIKTNPHVLDAAATIQKVITTTLVAGTGHIVLDGGPTTGNGMASMFFNLRAVDTALIGSTVRYYFDIQVKTASGKISTPDEGTIRLTAGVTDATT